MNQPNAEKLKHKIIDSARALGFDACRITSAQLPDQKGRHLREFVALSHHGTMDWMKDTLERRSSPDQLWPQARSVIVLAMNYGPTANPLEDLEQKDRGVISVYARNRDYHDVIKGKLKTLASKINAWKPGNFKVFVDTAPVMEKPIAHQAGIGWQGKHTNLVSRDFGSWLFLGSIFTDAQLLEDPREIDHCGSCTACLDICPTKAFPAPYRIDARRCISYLTIEHKGPIPAEFRTAMGNRIYGCDDCLAICPWNKFAQNAGEAKLQARDDLNHPNLEDLLTLDDADFRKLFSGSPIKRIGRNRFMRNVLIAAGNSCESSYIARIVELLEDDNELVRGAAIWALNKLADDQLFSQQYALYFHRETDETVREEWNRS